MAVTARDKLDLAQRHLERVQAAWYDPTDWADLSMYGFYCLENAVDAAALHLGLPTYTRHWETQELSGRLHVSHGLPDVRHLLADLNEARKAAAYGDVVAPALDAQDVAVRLEAYVEAVQVLVAPAGADE